MNLLNLLKNKFSSAVISLAAFFLFAVVFVIDIARKNIDIELDIILQVRSILIVSALFGIFIALSNYIPVKFTTPLRLFGLTLVTIFVLILVSIIGGFVTLGGFDVVEFDLHPVDFATIIGSTALSVTVAIGAIIFLIVIRELIFIKRKKGTKRNFLIFIVLLGATALSTWTLKPLEGSTLTSILFGLTIIAAIINSFKSTWIVYLSKREKVYSALFGFFIFLLFLGFTVIVSENNFLNQSLLYYNYPVRFFISTVSIFGAIYFGMSFIVAIFQLPAAEAFERKRIELSSLHNISRLITRVFNFEDLARTVTNLTIEVTEAQKAWLEIRREGSKSDTGNDFEVVAMKEITLHEIEIINNDDNGIRRHLLETGKVIVVDDFSEDKKTKHLAKKIRRTGSLIAVPLISQNNMIGIIFALKEFKFGFDKEDIEVISAFADHVTIALENSRLIEESIERERLQQEMLVARKVQRKLLPESIPSLEKYDLDAYSDSAYEVGGDYYDLEFLDKNRLGIVIGDVSGKGVYAAFYMAELKGIFQVLNRENLSAREFLIRANGALYGAIEKSAFISLIYAILNTENDTLCIARAGHCPMIHLSGDSVEMHKPNGMGLGLTGSELFDKVIEEKDVKLNKGDICLFYTDGISEARNSNREEFGTDRIVKLLKKHRNINAAEIRKLLLDEVRKHTAGESINDDLTLVIIKKGKGASNE